MPARDTSLDTILRRVRASLLAAMVARLGADKLPLAEDVCQDALEKAVASWSYAGIPDKPLAWLKIAAWRRAVDVLRREAFLAPMADDQGEQGADPPAFDGDGGQDEDLRLLYLACHPGLSLRDQMMLGLQLGAGFTAKDIADLMFMKASAVGQRLARAKRKLRAGGPDDLLTLSPDEQKNRRLTVLNCVYLMFTAAYAPRRQNALLVRDTAGEALRLVRILTAQNPHCAEAAAAAALLCFQASRFDARTGADGRLLLLKDQNRAVWDQGLIAEGAAHLGRAKAGTALSRYHLEAGIAAVHAFAPRWEDTDWQAINTLYGRLVALYPSLAVLVNAAIAKAEIGDIGAAQQLVDRAEACPEAAHHGGTALAQAHIASLQGRIEDARRYLIAARSLDQRTAVRAHIDALLESGA